MPKQDWIRCPSCGQKTRDRIRQDTILQCFPLFCPKCKYRCLINAKNLQIAVINGPAALDAEPMNA